MSKPSTLAKQLQAVANKAYNEGYYYGHAEIRAICLDTVIISLGEIGITPKQIHDFCLKYNEIEQDFTDMITADGESVTDGRGKDLHDITYTKGKIDEKIKQYILEEDFVPFEERHPIYSKPPRF